MTYCVLSLTLNPLHLLTRNELMPILVQKLQMKYSLVPRKITKIVAARHTSSPQNTPKYFWGRGSILDPGETYSAPQTS